MSLSVQSIEQSSQIVTSHSTAAVTSSSSSSFKEALDTFYEIHQRSQITGVSTYSYNKALDSIGIDSLHTFAAIEGINLLQSYGYDTNKPTDAAIVKYGAIDQGYGNKSYMKNGTSLSSEALKEEIEVLNEETDNAYAGAQNYYDVALKNIDSAPLEFNAMHSSIAPTSEPTILSTDETLRNLIKSEIVTILKSDESLLRELLKEFL